MMSECRSNRSHPIVWDTDLSRSEVRSFGKDWNDRQTVTVRDRFTNSFSQGLIARKIQACQNRLHGIMSEDARWIRSEAEQAVAAIENRSRPHVNYRDPEEVAASRSNLSRISETGTSNFSRFNDTCLEGLTSPTAVSPRA